jgi:trk system potassium uptake protein TrkA
VKALEDATGARVAYLMRFGLGTLPTPSTVLQEGDQVFMLVTDAMVESVAAVTAAPPTTA